MKKISRQYQRQLINSSIVNASFSDSISFVESISLILINFAEVKFFMFIFSIYFMALTIMPCHDSEDFQLDNKGLASINQNTTDGHYEKWH